MHAGRNTTLDKLGIAKTAREEKTRARDEKLKKTQKMPAWKRFIASTS